MLGGIPVVRKKLGKSGNRMGSDAGEDVFEPGEGVDTNPLTRGQKAPQHRGRVAAMVAAKEDPVVAANRDTANGTLGGVIIDLQIPILTVAGQCGPVLQAIPHRPTLGTLG